MKKIVYSLLFCSITVTHAVLHGSYRPVTMDKGILPEIQTTCAALGKAIKDDCRMCKLRTTYYCNKTIIKPVKTCMHVTAKMSRECANAVARHSRECIQTCKSIPPQIKNAGRACSRECKMLPTDCKHVIKQIPETVLNSYCCVEPCEGCATCFDAATLCIENRCNGDLCCECCVRCSFCGIAIAAALQSTQDNPCGAIIAAICTVAACGHPSDGVKKIFAPLNQ